ncbi:serine/threonine-protein kinase [Nonomuraea africana]|uniref:Serine/threonine protein kinase n=1 Tax=Nonomuraea africana TaxID=46171 RepID=A0ABR9KPT4_9ACTN|nr:serine/threonine-protein kinase [Nonomuraea africana]MBE1563532.1 serine/threonine protein kinase [Nonomuraea africana]
MKPMGPAPLRPTDARQIGPYRLLGRIGEGGMGTVFLAIAPTGRPVAVKVVKAEFANQKGFAARFHAEVDNARRVASFCTAQVLDNGNDSAGRPYMVTEYIAGVPLSEQISEFGALEPAALHGVALGVAAALAAIHVAGLVHRDLKPANVILSMSGPRVIDFGISRALDRESNFTLSGELLGSPGWWAPEQVRGQQITPAADIFTWGCLVAYAGSGRHPFGRGDAVTLATRVLHQTPDLGALPAPLNDLVRRATAMDPLLRPTAQDLLLALVGGRLPTRDQSTRDQSTRGQSTGESTRVATDLLDRNWAPPPNVADTAVRSTSILRQDREQAPPPPPEKARPKSRRWLAAAAAAAVALIVTIVVLLVGNPSEPPSAPRGAPTLVAPDSGRRFNLGTALDDPQFLLTGQPRCGLTDYQGTRPANGRFCVIGWAMLNPGGTQRAIGSSGVTLVDDRGARHQAAAASTKLPATVAPGERIDGVFVFDLPPQRLPSMLEGTLMQGGRRIEVRLS